MMSTTAPWRLPAPPALHHLAGADGGIGTAAAAAPTSLSATASATASAVSAATVDSLTFRFHRRTQRLNWNDVLEVDLGTIIKTVDLASLHSLVEQLTFADIGDEDVDHFTDVNILHLLRIYQLVMEYVLFGWQCAHLHCSQRDVKYHHLKNAYDKLKSKLQQERNTMMNMKKELHYAKMVVKTLEETNHPSLIRHSQQQQQQPMQPTTEEKEQLPATTTSSSSTSALSPNDISIRAAVAAESKRQQDQIAELQRQLNAALQQLEKINAAASGATGAQHGRASSVESVSTLQPTTITQQPSAAAAENAVVAPSQTVSNTANALNEASQKEREDARAAAVAADAADEPLQSLSQSQPHSQPSSASSSTSLSPSAPAVDPAQVESLVDVLRQIQRDELDSELSTLEQERAEVMHRRRHELELLQLQQQQQQLQHNQALMHSDVSSQSSSSQPQPHLMQPDHPLLQGTVLASPRPPVDAGHMRTTSGTSNGGDGGLGQPLASPSSQLLSSPAASSSSLVPFQQQLRIQVSSPVATGPPLPSHHAQAMQPHSAHHPAPQSTTVAAAATAASIDDVDVDVDADPRTATEAAATFASQLISSSQAALQATAAHLASLSPTSRSHALESEARKIRLQSIISARSDATLNLKHHPFPSMPFVNAMYKHDPEPLRQAYDDVYLWHGTAVRTKENAQELLTTAVECDPDGTIYDDINARVEAAMQAHLLPSLHADPERAAALERLAERESYLPQLEADEHVRRLRDAQWHEDRIAAFEQAYVSHLASEDERRRVEEHIARMQNDAREVALREYIANLKAQSEEARRRAMPLMPAASVVSREMHDAATQRAREVQQQQANLLLRNAVPLSSPNMSAAVSPSVSMQLQPGYQQQQQQHRPSQQRRHSRAMLGSGGSGGRNVGGADEFDDDGDDDAIDDEYDATASGSERLRTQARSQLSTHDGNNDMLFRRPSPRPSTSIGGGGTALSARTRRAADNANDNDDPDAVEPFMRSVTASPVNDRSAATNDNTVLGARKNTRSQPASSASSLQLPTGGSSAARPSASATRKAPLAALRQRDEFDFSDDDEVGDVGINSRAQTTATQPQQSQAQAAVTAAVNNDSDVSIEEVPLEPARTQRAPSSSSPSAGNSNLASTRPATSVTGGVAPAASSSSAANLTPPRSSFRPSTGRRALLNQHSMQSHSSQQLQDSDDSDASLNPLASEEAASALQAAESASQMRSADLRAGSANGHGDTMQQMASLPSAASATNPIADAAPSSSSSFSPGRGSSASRRRALGTTLTNLGSVLNTTAASTTSNAQPSSSASAATVNTNTVPSAATITPPIAPSHPSTNAPSRPAFHGAATGGVGAGEDSDLSSDVSLMTLDDAAAMRHRPPRRTSIGTAANTNTSSNAGSSGGAGGVRGSTSGTGSMGSQLSVSSAGGSTASLRRGDRSQSPSFAATPSPAASDYYAGDHGAPPLPTQPPVARASIIGLASSPSSLGGSSGILAPTKGRPRGSAISTRLSGGASSSPLHGTRTASSSAPAMEEDSLSTLVAGLGVATGRRTSARPSSVTNASNRTRFRDASENESVISE